MKLLVLAKYLTLDPHINYYGNNNNYKHLTKIYLQVLKKYYVIY